MEGMENRGQRLPVEAMEATRKWFGVESPCRIRECIAGKRMGRKKDVS